VSYRLEFKRTAQQQTLRLGRRNPELAADIAAKIQWLAENADVIKHEKLKGARQYSLHCGQYRILYELERRRKVIIIEKIGKHDEVYR